MRRGMSLLEVVLALAILGIALAMIGELIRMGTRAGEAARDDMESQLICESIINEIAAGTQLPDPVVDQAVDELGEWLYSVESYPVDQASLIAIRVSVRRTDKIVSTTRPEPLPYSLTRWMIDPEIELAARDAEAVMQEQLKLRASSQASGTQTDAGAAQSNPSQGGGGGAPPATAAPNPATLPAGAPPGFGPDGPGQTPGGRGGRGGDGGRGSDGGRGGQGGPGGGRGGPGAGGPGGGGPGGGGPGGGGPGGGRGGRGGGGFGGGGPGGGGPGGGGPGGGGRGGPGGGGRGGGS